MRIIKCALPFLLLAVGCVSKPPLHFSPEKLPEAKAGQAYNATIAVDNNETPVGELSVSKGELPEGLALTFDKNGHKAAIAGTPTAAGTKNFTVSGWCYGTNVSGQTGEKVYEIVVR